MQGAIWSKSSADSRKTCTGEARQADHPHKLYSHSTSNRNLKLTCRLLTDTRHPVWRLGCKHPNEACIVIVLALVALVWLYNNLHILYYLDLRYLRQEIYGTHFVAEAYSCPVQEKYMHQYIVYSQDIQKNH